MARIGISQEQVFAAADRLVSDGIKVTHRTIRDQLGSGSPNNIHRHLKDWKTARGLTELPKRQLAAPIVDAINQEIERLSAAFRKDLEGQLEEEQQSANQIAEHADALDAQIQELHQTISSLKSAHDRLEGRTVEQAHEIDRLRRQLDDERMALGKSQQDNAVLVSEKTFQTQHLAGAVSREKQALDRLTAVEQRERQSMAELAAAQSALESGKTTIEALRQECIELKRELKTTRQ
ncbi:MAG: hypothetical protein CML16_18215 [Pusillimonas sp.]|nr:hypothetical protein [Pusillimonas sp.]MBC43729.1 hypothetical protein [Pusillimonas sp.]HCN70406.1 hypothetical protein [Pusillimonas sp.]|tara:strand:- start:24025 stop:24732 length:708 start_codon:yes stop_codon:yes gene_type:complete